MKTWKKFAALAVALPLTLAACGGDDGSNSNGSDGSAGDGTLTVWAWDPAFNIYAINEAAKIYQEDHPDVQVEVIETPWDDLQTKLTTLAQSQETKELPDIFLMQNNAFQKNLVNYPDLFSDFTDSDVDFGEFPDGVVAYSTLDDVHYGLPFDNGTALTALRIDVLEEAGYTLDDFSDITWDEFIVQGKDVLAKTGKPMLSGNIGESDLIMMMLQSAGASLFDDEGNPTIVGNDALIKAIEVYKELMDSGVFVGINSWDEYIGGFVNGNVAAVLNGVWILGSIQSAEGQSGLWRITNVPKLEGVDGSTNFTANGGSSWVISSNADQELAADFLASTFAGSKELYDTILPSAGAVGNWLPAGDSDAYNAPQEFFGGEPVYSTVLEFSTEVPTNNTGVYYYEARDAVTTAATQVVAGADINTALEEAQKTVEFAMQ